MDSHLLSNITKDFLNLDPEFIPPRERYRMGWGGSVLVSHQKALPGTRERKPAVARLLALRERFANLFSLSEPPPSIPLSTSPKLSLPKAPPPATFRPAWYFSRGALENDRRKNPEPIPYLLTETNETALAQPVPGNSMLFRSLCRGNGALRRNKQGLVYLDVDNQFISMMFPYLKKVGLVRPPYFNLFDAPEGAHIPVISAREASFQYLDEVRELGASFSFEIEGLYSMEPVSWPEVEQVWFFKVRSSELEAFRRKYFLPAHPGGHPFHIAVAVKPRVTAGEPPRPMPLMRINIAFLAA
ncbi:MAG: hypothetical protein WCF19_02945 [Chlamydiales bacterium]